MLIDDIWTRNAFSIFPPTPMWEESWMTYYTGQVVNLLGTCHGLKYLRPTRLGMHPVMGGPEPLETPGWPVAKNWLPKHNGLQGDTSSHHVLTFSSSVSTIPAPRAKWQNLAPLRVETGPFSSSNGGICLIVSPASINVYNFSVLIPLWPDVWSEFVTSPVLPWNFDYIHSFGE